MRCSAFEPGKVSPGPARSCIQNLSYISAAPFLGNQRSGMDVITDMAKAVWNGIVIAESESYETVEGKVFFPETSLKRDFFRPSSSTSPCPWKGQPRYYSLFSDGQENPDA